MIKDLAKEKDETETELPQMSQVWTLFCVKNSLSCQMICLEVRLVIQLGLFCFQSHY